MKVSVFLYPIADEAIHHACGKSDTYKPILTEKRLIHKSDTMHKGKGEKYAKYKAKLTLFHICVGTRNIFSKIIVKKVWHLQKM